MVCVGAAVSKKSDLFYGSLLLVCQSVLESHAGKIQGRSLQGGVFVVENYVPSWQRSCSSQLCSCGGRKTLMSKQFQQLESAYVLLHSSGPGAEKWSSTMFLFQLNSSTWRCQVHFLYGTVLGNEHNGFILCQPDLGHGHVEVCPICSLEIILRCKGLFQN